MCKKWNKLRKHLNLKQLNQLIKTINYTLFKTHKKNTYQFIYLLICFREIKVKFNQGRVYFIPFLKESLNL